MIKGSWKTVTPVVIRVLMTGTLLVFVYFETGWATALSLALVFLSIEANAKLVSMIQESVSRITNILLIKELRDGVMEKVDDNAKG